MNVSSTSTATDPGIVREARAIHDSSDVIDLHLDTFIWNRILGNDPANPRKSGLRARGPRGNYFGHVDLPRLSEAGITGGIWSITTNPFRSARGRARTFERNLEILDSSLTAGGARLVRNAAEYRAARAERKHAAMIGVQGGNAFSADLDLLSKSAPRLVKVTVLHLLNSDLGATSTPIPFSHVEPFTKKGIEVVERLNADRVFVDLAHIGHAGFHAAVRAHDRTQPLLASHTGVCGVHPHWRNLEDDQLRAIADTGGVIGIIFERRFLGAGARGNRIEAVVEHIDHVVRTVGEDYAALGSDWDGMISPPDALKSCTGLPLVAEAMLSRGYSSERIRKILGGNFLRAWTSLRS